ncbi:MAG: lipopolysaccharide biosynthesis protein [Planctomycetota bacterium]
MTHPPTNDDATPRRDRWFRTDDLVKGIGKRSARGGAYTFATTGLNLAVTTAATILVTRQLTQEDFGLYGMVIVLTGFARLFADLGLSRAVVQRPHVTHAQVSTLFWINLGVATAIAAVVAAATPLVVAFYNEPRLAPINLAMAGLFVVNGLGRQHRALLERRMEFGRINLVTASLTPIGAIAGVVVALLGGGYWALAAIPAASAIAAAAGMWLACDWRPGPPRRHTGVRSMLAFGGHVTGVQVINYFARNADNAMLGFAWGAGPLGLYTRAYSLMMLPITKVNSPLLGVVIPALAKLTNEPESYRRYYTRALGLVTATLTPAIVLILILIDDIVPLALGNQWITIVPIFYALGPACLMGVSNSATGWLYLSCGHVHRQTRWAFIHISISTIAMTAGVQFGAIGMAIAVSCVYVLLKPFAILWAVKSTPVPFGLAARTIYMPLVAATVAITATLLALSLVASSYESHLRLALKLGCFAAVYIVWFALTPWGQRDVGNVMSVLSHLTRGNREAPLSSEPQQEK